MYPNFKDKYLKESLFSPEDFFKYKPLNKSNFPKKWILFFSKKPESYIKRKFKLKKDKENHLAGNLYIHNKIGFFKMNGIGAPNAVVVTEELIALGAKEFIAIGTAGGLQNFGIFLCDKAIRDEGTSYHYLPKGKHSYPSKELSEKLGKSIQKKGLFFEKGTTWTVDAPYRETRVEADYYRKQGVKSVEMEASALFAVAQFRKVKIAAAFVISDLLQKQGWDPQFDKKRVKIKMNRLVDAAIDCFSN